MNPMDIKRGIDKAVEQVIEKLKTSSKVKANEEVPRLEQFLQMVKNLLAI